MICDRTETLLSLDEPSVGSLYLPFIYHLCVFCSSSSDYACSQGDESFYRYIAAMFAICRLARHKAIPTVL